MAGDYDYVLNCFDLYVFAWEDFVNLLAQAEDVEVNQQLERLALIGVIPKNQRASAVTLTVDHDLSRTDDDGVGDIGVGNRKALHASRRSDEKRAPDQDMERFARGGNVR